MLYNETPCEYRTNMLGAAAGGRGIFLSGNSFAVVKVINFTYLTCHHFDRNGRVQTAATTGIQEKVGSKANSLSGRVSSRSVVVTAGPKARSNKRSAE